ncbi:COG3637 Opacity protein and related surface antigens [Rhabdaerophilaceae bacterium]
MLRLTTLRLAGIAAVFSAGSAMAADMLGHPPPPPPLLHAPQPIDVGSGFYLRGDVGAGVYNYDRLDFQPGLANGRTIHNMLESAGHFGVGAGYQFNSWLRTDATIEYRTPAHFQAFEEQRLVNQTGAPVPSGYNMISGKMSAIVGLANAYVDLGTWQRITPFIGAGIGFASITKSNVEDHGYGAYAGGYGKAPTKTQTRLAWALHAGLGYDLSSNWKAEVGYRYLNMGRVESGNVACTVPCPAFNSRITNLQAHDIRAGLRYVFADQPLAVAPGPLLRKY